MKFKRFTVRDEKCAMKIGTDAVLLGAIAEHTNPSNILDIGTGSGIVALMLAQRFENAQITAVELDMEASIQAEDNFQNSPFNDRLTCINDSFQNVASQLNGNKYDLIVSNPPFFDGTSKSPSEARNMARHQDYLKIDELFSGVLNVLKDSGIVVVVWPIEREGVLIESAKKHGFFNNSRSEVYATINHEAVRIISEFSKECTTFKKSEIVLENGVGDSREFTPEYLELMQDFFLKA